MIAKQPRGPGSHSAERSASGRLAEAIRKLTHRPAGGDGPAGGGSPAGRLYGPGRFDREHKMPLWECQRPDAPADLPTIHGLQLAAIEARLLKLEQQVSNQNRLLLIGVIAVVGDIVRQLLKL